MRAHYVAILIGAQIASTSAANANSYDQDANSCNLNSQTTLTQLCPNGFGVPEYGSVQHQIATHANHANMIVDAANAQGVPPALALAVSGAEGGMSACAGSFTGVKGPMQLTSGTAKTLGVNYNIDAQNISGGVSVLKQAITQCGGTSDVACLASVYNGSTAQQQATWTANVTKYEAQLAANSSLTPTGCNAVACPIGSGGFEGFGGGATASAAPASASTDVVVAANQV